MARISNADQAKAVRNWVLSLPESERKALLALGGSGMLAAYEKAHESEKPSAGNIERLVPEKFGILVNNDVVRLVTLEKFAAPRLPKDAPQAVKDARAARRRMYGEKYKAGIVDLLMAASFMENATVVSLKTVDGEKLSDFTAESDSEEDILADLEEGSSL